VIGQIPARYRSATRSHTRSATWIT